MSDCSKVDIYDELERWSNAAAQELRELLDDAEDGGSTLTGVQALLEEHNAIIQQLGGTWQDQYAKAAPGPAYQIPFEKSETPA